VSGFDGIVPDPEIFKEVIMLCCAIKPLCAWNCQVRSASVCHVSQMLMRQCINVRMSRLCFGSLNAHACRCMSVEFLNCVKGSGCLVSEICGTSLVIQAKVMI
jgi:hypothetical protein